jgi:hypothetical protein
MPEVNQLFFSHKEVLELLIKKAGIHEGKWVLSANFGFSTGNFGPSPDQFSPGAIVALVSLGIAKAIPEAPEQMVMDAAVVNPEPVRARKKA